jgi:hypothetical protein
LPEIGTINKPKQCKFDSLHLKIQKTTLAKVLFDDTLITYRFDLGDSDDLKIREGNKWFSIAEIAELSGEWPEIDLCILGKKWSIYNQYEFVSDYHL